ncbi:hypothetical protein VNO80_21503 [Phaseolus coccineus]|uniref:Uncharacterized protein n=1 Tax=Phaseolus coccineus TaxID=3886 RepID=A0AAN9M3E3_PHACN
MSCLSFPLPQSIDVETTQVTVLIDILPNCYVYNRNGTRTIYSIDCNHVGFRIRRVVVFTFSDIMSS